MPSIDRLQLPVPAILPEVQLIRTPPDCAEIHAPDSEYEDTRAVSEQPHVWEADVCCATNSSNSSSQSIYRLLAESVDEEHINDVKAGVLDPDSPLHGSDSRDPRQDSLGSQAEEIPGLSDLEIEATCGKLGQCRGNKVDVYRVEIEMSLGRRLEFAEIRSTCKRTSIGFERPFGHVSAWLEGLEPTQNAHDLLHQSPGHPGFSLQEPTSTAMIEPPEPPARKGDHTPSCDEDHGQR